MNKLNINFYDGWWLVILTLRCWLTKKKYFRKYSFQSYLGFQNINFGEIETPWDKYKKEKYLKKFNVHKS